MFQYLCLEEWDTDLCGQPKFMSIGKEKESPLKRLNVGGVVILWYDKFVWS